MSMSESNLLRADGSFRAHLPNDPIPEHTWADVLWDDGCVGFNQHAPNLNWTKIVAWAPSIERASDRKLKSNLEDAIEAAYWEFDAIRAQKKGSISERDSFKAGLRTHLYPLVGKALSVPPSPKEPVLVIIRGFVGTGKTTLANMFAKEFGMTLLERDMYRQESGNYIYNKAEDEALSWRLLCETTSELNRGRSVVITGTFINEEKLMPYFLFKFKKFVIEKFFQYGNTHNVSRQDCEYIRDNFTPLNPALYSLFNVVPLHAPTDVSYVDLMRASL
jgi:AAA domain